MGDECGEHFGRHETNPHWVAVCTLPSGHDGDHDNVLDKPPSPDTAADSPTGGAERG